MKSTNASASAFWWDFQSNAAIMLMLKNIKIATAVKVEGEKEDIEITLDNGNTIYSQAKSVFDPYNDFNNVIAKLKAGLKTLNSVGDIENVAQLIYITNSATELGVSETYVRPNEDYIFTSDLKSLTGAIFHKIVFAFKMSYITLIKNHTGTILPVILDSPSGREIDQENVSGMMAILARDFNEHQIIISSIHYYDFISPHIIEIEKRLLSF